MNKGANYPSGRAAGFLVLTLGIALLIAGWGFYVEYSTQSTLAPNAQSENRNYSIDEERSGIGTKENPQARAAYNYAIVVDPATGSLPPQIKRREYLFSATLPVRPSGSQARSNKTYEEEWRSIGPYNKGGRTRALAISAANEKILMAGGVSGGMWRSENGGSSWTKTTVSASIYSVTCIAQDTRPTKTTIWYYGSGEFSSNSANKGNAPFRGDGVFKSVDDGTTWTQLASTAEGIPNNYNSQFQYIWEIITNPFNTIQDELYVATVGAIFRSIDGGNTFSPVLGRKIPSTTNTDLNSANLSDFANIAQTSNGVYYAILSQIARKGSSPDAGVYRSDNGINWTRITPAIWPKGYSRTLIAPSSTDPSIVYFSINADPDRLIKYQYLRGDGAGSNGVWTDLSANLPDFGGETGKYDTQNSYNMVLETHPDDGNIVFLGGTNLYRSGDGFSTKENVAWIGGYNTKNDVTIYTNHYVDQHALAFFQSDPNKMLSSNDGGVFITYNNLLKEPTWQTLNNGFVTTQFYTLGIDEFSSKGAIMGGLQDNGTLIGNKPIDVSPWNSVISGDGGYCQVSANQYYYYASFQYGKTYRFTLDKNQQRINFARIDPLGSGGEDKLLFVNPYILAPENQNMMYYAGGDAVWRNRNLAQAPLFTNNPTTVNWEKMDFAMTSGATVSAISATYNPAGIVYFGTTKGQLYKISNSASDNYSIDEITSPSFPADAYISCVAIDKKQSNNIIVVFSNYNVQSLFYSDDGGESFENISGNLEENPDGSGSGPSVRWVEIVSKNTGPSQYFAGTSTGLYSTETLNGNASVWQKEGNETIGNALVMMLKYFSNDGTLVIATHGSGMYEARLSDVWHTEIDEMVAAFSLGDASPNPTAGTTSVPFSIPEDGQVKAEIYTLSGQLIKSLMWAKLYAGDNIVSWDATNEAGGHVNSGVYILRLEYAGQSAGSKILVYN